MDSVSLGPSYPQAVLLERERDTWLAPQNPFLMLTQAIVKTLLLFQGKQVGEVFR